MLIKLLIVYQILRYWDVIVQYFLTIPVAGAAWSFCRPKIHVPFFRHFNISVEKCLLLNKSLVMCFLTKDFLYGVVGAVCNSDVRRS